MPITTTLPSRTPSWTTFYENMVEGTVFRQNMLKPITKSHPHSHTVLKLDPAVCTSQANTRLRLCDCMMQEKIYGLNISKSSYVQSCTYTFIIIYQRKFRNLTSDYTESCCWRSVNQEMWSRRCETAEMWDMRIWRAGSAWNAVFFHSFVTSLAGKVSS